MASVKEEKYNLKAVQTKLFSIVHDTKYPQIPRQRPRLIVTILGGRLDDTQISLTTEENTARRIMRKESPPEATRKNIWDNERKSHLGLAKEAQHIGYQANRRKNVGIGEQTRGGGDQPTD